MHPILVLGALLAVHPASGPPTDGEAPHGAKQHRAGESGELVEEPDPYHSLVAVKIIAGTSRAAEGNTDLFGPGGDVEFTLFPEWGVELELAAALLLSEDLTSVPVELLVKKSFHVDPRTDFFLAGGGVTNAVFREDGERDVLFGAIVVAGAYLWHSDQFGLLLELAYAPYFVHGRVEHDLEGAVGVAHRF